MRVLCVFALLFPFVAQRVIAQAPPSSDSEAAVGSSDASAPDRADRDPEATLVSGDHVDLDVLSKLAEKQKLMELDKEMLPADAEADFKRFATKYRNAMYSGAANKADEDFIRRGIRYRVLNLSLRKHRDNLKAVKDRLDRDLNVAGQLINQAAAFKKHREFVLEEVVRNCEALLDNNFIVRFYAVMILTELELVPGQAGQEPEPYPGPYQRLLKVLEDPDGFIELRLQALRGLKRYLQYDKTDARIQMEIAAGVVNELDRLGRLPEKRQSVTGVTWYQVALCKCLAQLKTPREFGGQRRAIAVESLQRALADRKRHWLVRSAAAYSLGRVAMDAQIRPDPIAVSIAELCHEMTVAVNAAVKQAREDKPPGGMPAFWKKAFFEIYLAFHHRDQSELERKHGLLNRTPSAKVQAAYGKVLPVVQQVLSHDPPVTEEVTKALTEALKALDEWLQQNRVGDIPRLNSRRVNTAARPR